MIGDTNCLVFPFAIILLRPIYAVCVCVIERDWLYELLSHCRLRYYYTYNISHCCNDTK